MGLADDIAAIMQEFGLPRAHEAGLSRGAAIGHLAGEQVPGARQNALAAQSLAEVRHIPVYGGGELAAVATGMGNVPDAIITGIFPWGFTPDFYSNNSDYIASLEDFGRGRPVQPVESFLRQSAAVHPSRSAPSCSNASRPWPSG
jgi:hypothetical protein